MGADFVTGWAVEPDQRASLLARLPPAYADAVADHVTLWSGQPADAPLPSETKGEIIGRADDGQGVEAMVVRIGGTHRRPDGGVYHITWSLDRAAGRRGKDSNDVIARLGWRDLPPVEVKLRPARFPR